MVVILLRCSYLLKYICPQVFEANNDTDTAVTQYLPEPISVKVIRIRPKEWESHIGMRFELLRCEGNYCFITVFFLFVCLFVCFVLFCFVFFQFYTLNLCEVSNAYTFIHIYSDRKEQINCFTGLIDPDLVFVETSSC